MTLRQRIHNARILHEQFQNARAAEIGLLNASIDRLIGAGEDAVAMDLIHIRDAALRRLDVEHHFVTLLLHEITQVPDRAQQIAETVGELSVQAINAVRGGKDV